METVELRDPDLARTYVLQGLRLQRVVPPAAGLVRPVLDWALEICAGGQPLPPVGVVADLGNLVYGHDRGRAGHAAADAPGWPATLTRSYDDHVLGKLYADWTFDRATDALRRYAPKEQARGLAYVVRQLRDRAGVGGVELSPAVVRGLLGVPADEVLALGYESLARDGPLPLLVKQYEQLISAARRTAEVLGPEDVTALEQRTALADMGQYVAHRQIVQAADRIAARLPARPAKPAAGRKEVPTRVLDEDQYPVGGYTSIATKGSVESLLHSQLAFMEDQQPDLFDMKFVRDELFYYSRDENQFLCRRRLFVFAFAPDLVAARFKDATLPAQRVVYTLAAVVALVRKLTDWLTADALRFELVFLAGPPDKPAPLGHERELFELLLRDPVSRGSAGLRALPSAAALRQYLDAEARTSQVHCLTVGVRPPAVPAEAAVVTTLTVAGPSPGLTDGHGVVVPLDADDPADQWAEMAARVLALWV